MPNDTWPLEPDTPTLRSQTQACVEHVLRHIETLEEQPSFDLDGAEDLARSFEEPPPEDGSNLDGLLQGLLPAFGKSYNTAGPGYLAYIPGGGIYAAALADFMACALNRYVGVSQASPVLSQIEETAVSWLARLMDYPATARGILTSGGSLSTLSAIVTARTAKLPEDFLSGVIYVSEEAHHCVPKAARLAGFPKANLRVLPVDSRFRLQPDALEAAIREDMLRGLTPFLCVANAGSTNTGAVDPIPEIVALARRHGLWVHADAAYGGFFRLIPGGEKLLSGLEECDSITLDPHKGLFLPYGLGCLLVRDGEALYRTHRETGRYMQDLRREETEVSFNDLSPELSRDFRGLRLWLPLKLHGLEAFRQALQEKLELARYAYDQLREDPLFEMLDEPQLSVVAFRLRGTPAEADAAGAELLRRVNARRRVFLSSTEIDGRYVLRICVLCFRTHRDRVQDAVTALREEAQALLS
jgi:aromatic-L-amino-acid decarboxylase